MKYFTKEVKIGLAGVVALAMLFIGINFLKGINLFKSSQTYYVSFQNAKGLAKSSPVYADGYNIGIVSNILYDYNQPGRVLVEIQVDNCLRVPKGSSAELISEMLGGCTMNLLLANNPRERMAPGDTITGTESQGLMDQAATLIPQVEQVLGKVDTLLTTLNRLAADPALTAIMQNTQAVTQNLNQSTAQLNRLLSKDMPMLTHTYTQAGENLTELTGNLKKLNLQATLDKANNTLDNVGQMTERLNRPDNTLGLLLNDTLLYSNLNSTVGSANNLLIDLKARPKRYVHFSVFGRKDK